MSDLPKAMYSDEFTVCGVTLRVHVLDNGQRLIEEESVAAFLRMLSREKKLTQADIDQLARAIHGVGG